MSVYGIQAALPFWATPAPSTSPYSCVAGLPSQELKSRTMRLGFTGARKGMSDQQKEALRQLLIEFQPTEFHHGDCIGADSQAHAIVRAHSRAKIIIHPPNKDRYRAFCEGDRSKPPKEYLQRNRDIVDECDMLLAAPETEREELRSGTWSTVRYARGNNVSVAILKP
jgi:hypothetical protein